MAYRIAGALLRVAQFGSIMPSTNAAGTVKMGRSVVVKAIWDPEASVWVATSDDLPLVTEAPSMDALMAKLPGLLQDLLEDIGDNDGEEMDVPFEVIAHIHESVRIRRAA